MGCNTLMRRGDELKGNVVDVYSTGVGGAKKSLERMFVDCFDLVIRVAQDALSKGGQPLRWG